MVEFCLDEVFGELLHQRRIILPQYKSFQNGMIIHQVIDASQSHTTRSVKNRGQRCGKFRVQRDEIPQILMCGRQRL